ncbi:MAG: hypothetical protein IM568_11640 [Flavobacterium sp.]|nr:hypothetical protein [Flavobacterium sp.]
METDNKIRLRLRFFKDIEENIDVVRQKFIDYRKVISTDFYIKIRENYIQFTISGEKQQYWSPHLSIVLEEMEGNEKNATHIRGLFGPAQTMWTFFMFLHFFIAGTFLLFAMFAYSNYTLKEPIMMDLIIMFVMVFVWFLLYVIARQLREKGNDQMKDLENEFEKIMAS